MIKWFALLVLIPLAGAWSDDIHLWFANQTLAECPESALEAFEPVSCTSEALMEIARNKSCEGRVRASYAYLCLYRTDSTCEDRLNQRIGAWLAEGGWWIFEDCGVIISRFDFDVMVQKFNCEFPLEDAFDGFEGGDYYGSIIDLFIDRYNATEEPKEPAVAEDTGSASNTAPFALDLALSRPFDLVFLSSFEGFPVFLVWGSLLFLIFGLIWAGKGKKATFAQTYTDTTVKVDAEKGDKKPVKEQKGGRYFRGTLWTSFTAQFNFTLYSWIAAVVMLAALTLILPAIGLEIFALPACALWLLFEIWLLRAF